MRKIFVSKDFFTGRLFLFLMFIAIEVFIVFYFIHDYRKIDSVYRSKMQQAFEASFLGAVTSYDHSTKIIFYDVINKPEVLKLISRALDDKGKRDNIRNELYRLMLPSYETQTAIGIRQLHFHLKDGTSFLRMHAPEKYGDNLFMRPGVYRVNTEQKHVSGYEAGYFADGYRYMYPLFYSGRHIGSVEFGISSEGIIDHVNEIYPGHYLFMIDRTIVDSLTHKDRLKMNYRKSDLSDHFMIGQEIPEDTVITSINKKLKNRVGVNLAGMEKFVYKETLNGQNHLIVYLPIHDITGKPIAYFAQYVADEYAGHHSRLATIDILLFTFLLAAIFYSIDFIQSRRKMIEQKNIELERSKYDVEKNHRILSSISKIQSAYIGASSSSEVFDMLLKDLIRLTESEYGFIGEVMRKQDGSPYLRTYAITDIAWNKETREFYDKYVLSGMEFHNLNTLFGACMKTGQPVIANDPEHDTRRGGLPEGHPSLKSFLGVPLMRGNHMIGMVGVANSPGGYDNNTLDYLETYLKTCANIIDAHKSELIRKSAEKTLQQYKLLSQYARDIILFIGMDGCIIESNEAAEKAYGYSKQELASMYITDLRSQQTLHSVEEQMSMADVQGLLFETVHRRRDGSTFSVEVSSSGVKIGGRRVLLSIIRDITERKRDENKLKQAEHELRNIYNSIYGFLTVVDRNFRIVGYNNAVEKQFGSNITGKLCYEVYQGRSHICPDCGVKKTLETGKPAFTFMPATPVSDPVEIYTAPLFDENGEIFAVIEHGIEVADKVKVLDALKESEERYRSLVKNVNSGFSYHEIVLDQDGAAVDYIFHEVNSTFEEMTGLRREDIIGRRVTEVLPGIKESSFDWIGTYGKVALTGEGIHFENYSEALDRWYSVSAYCPQRGYFATIFRDISDRMKAQAQIEQLYKNLFAKNRELEQILFATSHDLKTPLVNIHGFTRELEYSLNDLLDILKDGQMPANVIEKITNIIKEDIPESMKFIQTSIKKMNGLLDSLLKLSRLGRSELKLEYLNMDRLIEGVLESFEFLVKQKQISIAVSQLPSCRGDEIQIQQVFSNLIENALKYLDPSRACTISISGQREGGKVVYCVEDNGIGIAPGHQEMIFEIFYQLRPGEGEGIGLNIVQRIIELHNGRIWLESEPGKGSRFYVSLPE